MKPFPTPDGRLAAAIKRVPAEPPPREPEIPTLLGVIVDGFRDGTGHDTELTQHLGTSPPH